MKTVTKILSIAFLLVAFADLQAMDGDQEIARLRAELTEATADAQEASRVLIVSHATTVQLQEANEKLQEDKVSLLAACKTLEDAGNKLLETLQQNTEGHQQALTEWQGTISTLAEAFQQLKDNRQFDLNAAFGTGVVVGAGTATVIAVATIAAKTNKCTIS